MIHGLVSIKYKGEIHKGLDQIDEKKVSDADLVIFTAAHSNYDYEMIQKMRKQYLIQEMQ